MKKQQGFSLIELLVTAILLGGAALFLARFQGEMQKGNLLAGERNEAMKLAEARLDTARRSVITGIALNLATQSVASKTTTFTTNLAVAVTPAMANMALPVPAGSLVKMQSTVTWADAQGKTQNIVLASTVLRSRSASDFSNEPSNACTQAWASGNYARGTWKEDSGSLYYCFAANCTGQPSTSPAQWNNVRTCI